MGHDQCTSIRVHDQISLQSPSVSQPTVTFYLCPGTIRVVGAPLLTSATILIADIVIILREGLQTVGGVITVMCINYFYFVYSETAIVK